MKVLDTCRSLTPPSLAKGLASVKLAPVVKGLGVSALGV